MLVLFMNAASAYNFYEQLCTLNPNWTNYKDRVPAEQARIFSSGREYTQAHLEQVLHILATNPVNGLDAAQYSSRLHLIRLLDGYRQAGIFPINYFREERVPVFIDPNNIHCAVGYLLQQTGHEDIALRISAKNNYVWIKDIDDEALIQWQRRSGLSLDELKLIQPAYEMPFRPRREQIPANKYEILQQPACIETFFEIVNKKGKKQKTGYTWCKGEGINGILDGVWEQNYAIGVPWILGYFENGERSGQWTEYYKGTKQVYRIQEWSNGKLNGLSKSFDRNGELIEEIWFADGFSTAQTTPPSSPGFVPARYS